MAVGKRFVGMVMEEMLGKFQPGVLPHYFVVQTLANLSVFNGRCRLGLHPFTRVLERAVSSSEPCWLSVPPVSAASPAAWAEQKELKPCSVWWAQGVGGTGRGGAGLL